MKKVYSAHGTKKYLGFSLPELLVTLMLSSIIVLCLLRAYLSIKRQVINVQTTIQEQIDVAMIVDLLRSKISQAGFTPCGNIRQLHGIDRRTDQPLLDVIAQTSLLVLYHMDEPIVRINSILDHTHVLIDQASIFSDQPLLIADCHHAEVQSMLSINKKIITLAQPLAFNYHYPIYIGSWVQDAFFMKNTSSLIHKTQQAEELTRLIKGMTVHNLMSNGQTLLDLELLDQDAKTIHIVSMVRSQ